MKRFLAGMMDGLMCYVLPVVVLFGAVMGAMFILTQTLEEVFGQPAPATILQWSPGISLRNIKVIDGDTISADVLLPYGVTLERQYIRANDYDAWESRKIRRSVGPITDEEITKGKAAKAALQTLVDETTISLEPPANPKDFRDNYGRLLGRLYSDGHPVSNWMRRHDHCRPEPLKLEAEHDD